MLAYTYPLADLFGTMLGFFLLVIWLWLLIIVFSDIFRSHDLGGGAKALWVIFVIILPFLGIFVYLIARGGKMQRAGGEAGGTATEAFDTYVKETAGQKRTRRSSWPSWPTSSSRGSSLMPNSIHRRRRSWPEVDRSNSLTSRSNEKTTWTRQRNRLC